MHFLCVCARVLGMCLTGNVVQDMQLIMDVCPLRVDSLFMRDFHPADDLGGHCNQGAALKENIRAVLCITVLDMNQPVHITEAEVVRIKKRSRGLLMSTGLFSGR